MVEGQALAFVDGDGPSQSQRELSEHTPHVRLYLPGLLVEHVFGVFPLLWFHLDGIPVARTVYENGGIVEIGHVAYATVIIEVVGRRVVLDEHHLRSHLQRECLCCGISVLRKSALDVGTVGERGVRQLAEFRLVVVVGQIVVCGEAYKTLLRTGTEPSIAPCVELLQVVCRCPAVTDVVEYLDERGVLLPVHVVELDGHIVYLLQSLRSEKVGRVIVGIEYFRVFGRDDGCELLQVAYHQQLHAAERLVFVTIAAQHPVDGVKQIASHHRYLIDHEDVECADDFALLLAEVVAVADVGARNERRQRELEKRMDGHAGRIDGCHSRGCYHHHAFHAVFF